MDLLRSRVQRLFNQVERMEQLKGMHESANKSKDTLEPSRITEMTSRKLASRESSKDTGKL